MYCRECGQRRAEVSEAERLLAQVARVAARTERWTMVAKVAPAKQRLADCRERLARHRRLEHQGV